MVRVPITSVLVKPAGPDCNMACDYCFYLGKKALFPSHGARRMTDRTLEVLVKQAMHGGGTEVGFIWQGGEPTLAGLGFFKKVVAFQRRYGLNQIVCNALQTNGLLMDMAWAAFLRKYRFLVGLSLDGPRHVHDRYRKNRNGAGTWRRVRDAALMLRDHGVEVNALVVVNDYSARFAEEIYQFHKDVGLTWMQFIPCVEPDPEQPGKPASFSVTPKAYGRFLKSLFDLWTGDFRGTVPATSIRFFDAVFYSYVGLRPPVCHLLEECGDYVVVEHNGDVFACDFFVETECKLGNIHRRAVVDLLNSRRQRRFGQAKANRHGVCDDCPWLRFCWGGCPKDRQRDASTEGKSYFCESYKMFFEHADPWLRDLAVGWQTERDGRSSVLTDLRRKDL